MEEEGGHEAKNARSLVVASNWNTILTPKPKIGEYSSCPLRLLLFRSSSSPFLPSREFLFLQGGENKRSEESRLKSPTEKISSDRN